MKTDRKLTKPPRRENRGQWSEPAICPGCSQEGTLSERAILSTQEIRGEEIQCKVTKWVCSGCEASFMSPAQATAAVKRGVTAYQQKHDLLTAKEIREGRRSRRLSVPELAREAQVGEATIKRLEAGSTVQQQSTNRLLRISLTEGGELPDYVITFHLPPMKSACPSAASPWDEDVVWNSPEPWSASLKGTLGTFFEAADSNKLALAV